MDVLLAKAIELIFTKETVFFGLFLIGYILQINEKKEQRLFINKQQSVLERLTNSVSEIVKTQEKHEDRMERMERSQDDFLDKVNNKLKSHL